MPTLPASGVSFTVKTNGQPLIVAVGTSASSLVQTLYSDAACTASVTTPATITSDTTYYLPLDVANVAHYISCKQLDGTELWGKSQHLGGITIDPLPSRAQVAGDVSGVGRLTLAPTGALAETHSRATVTHANTAGLTSGQLRLVAIHLNAGTVVTNITFMSGTQAAVAPTAWWFALYSSGLVLRGQTADQTSTAWAANTAKTVALTTPYTITSTGLHYLGLCMVAGTPISMMCAASSGVGPLALSPILAATSSGSLTTTAPDPAGALTAATGLNYAYVS